MNANLKISILLFYSVFAIYDCVGQVKNKFVKQLTLHFKISNNRYIYHKILGSSISKVDMANIPVFSGFEVLHAFSDNRYRKKSKPIKYNHFRLYVYEYSDSLKAKGVFRELQYIVNTGHLNGIRYEKKTEILSAAAYFGGFICLKNNFIIWAVETCTNDYKTADPINELRLLKYLYNDIELKTTIFFNSDCGNEFRTYDYHSFIKKYGSVLK